MDFNHKLDKILQDIQEIEHYAVDFRNARNIPKIEMDIMMEKVRNLYDELLGIDRNYPYQGSSKNQDVSFEYSREENKEKPYREQPKPSETQRKSASGPAPEKKPEDTGDQSKNPSSQEDHKTEQEQQEETPVQEKTNNSQEKKSGIKYEDQSIEESKTVNRPMTGKNDIPEILADKFYNTKTSMHDSLSKNQPQNDLSSRMQSKPIQDLNKAIGLNDRFLFIRELFNGDKDAYYEAIQIINEMPGYEEAEEYIRQRFGWDEEKSEVVRFMELVRRRFIH